MTFIPVGRIICSLFVGTVAYAILLLLSSLTCGLIYSVHPAAVIPCAVIHFVWDRDEDGV